jgi:hypothetical protein
MEPLGGGGILKQSGRHGDEKILDPTRTRTMTPLPSSPQPVAIPTAIYWLLFCMGMLVINNAFMYY